MNAKFAPAPGLPLVLQLGFAGSRALFDAKAHHGVDAAQFESALHRSLTERLRRLPAELGLTDRHFVCGLSALAIGGDTLFTRACRELDWPQRLLLPQQREDFLHATGSDGTPDFPPAQRETARALFASPHVIQERVVSESADRHARFQDVNLELARACDVLVCLLRADAAGKPGGTLEALEHAAGRKRPVLELRVSVGPDGQPQWQETWRHRKKFTPPSLPPELAKLKTDLTGLPALTDYCAPLKAFASNTAKWKQTVFMGSAVIIIGTHILATLCAVLALKWDWRAVLPWLLGGELLLLVCGLATHEALHRFHAVRGWAMARLVAEIARSTLAARQVRGYLSHLVDLPLPASLCPLLRTLNVLHLRETRALAPAGWPARRDTCVQERFLAKKSGQIPYYLGKLRVAARWLAIARWTFLGASGSALLATFGKLILVGCCPPEHPALLQGGSAWLGGLAILLPVVAVAALSLAASFDLEARAHTYREMFNFLRVQRWHLRRAPTEAAFRTLALETEARLLGETAAWYSRRAFTGVA